MSIYQIADRDTGQLMSQVACFTRQQAEDKIAEWQDRHDRGGRPDITRDMLLRMHVIEVTR